MSLKLDKVFPVKGGEQFSISLRGDKETDEIGLLRLRGKNLKLVEEQPELALAVDEKESIWNAVNNNDLNALADILYQRKKSKEEPHAD